MPYTHFQYIAYKVPTITKATAGTPLYGISPGKPITAPSCVLTPVLRGNVAGLGNDAQRRIERLIGAMLAAQELLQRKSIDSPFTLKIFMVPEFYFRPDNKDVAYEIGQYKAIKMFYGKQ